jgi:hypothetical protein
MSRSRPQLARARQAHFARAAARRIMPGMRSSQFGLVLVGLMVGALSLMGCKGSSPTLSGTGGAGATTGGAGGSSPTGGAAGHLGDGGSTGAGGSTSDGGSTSTGGSPGTGGGSGAGGTLRDCFPACIANLRKACERPSLDGGSCISAAGMNCYSNGVHETAESVDGGELVTFTEPDGQTPCYRVAVSLSEERYETTGGALVAVVTFDGSLYTVTCDGATTTVDATNPACAMITEASCASATSCPP